MFFKMIVTVWARVTPSIKYCNYNRICHVTYKIWKCSLINFCYI
jgi:hypothetical protein